MIHSQPDGPAQSSRHHATGQRPENAHPKRTLWHGLPGPKSAPASKSGTSEGRSLGAIDLAADATAVSQAADAQKPSAASSSSAFRNAGGFLLTEVALPVCLLPCSAQRCTFQEFSFYWFSINTLGCRLHGDVCSVAAIEY